MNDFHSMQTYMQTYTQPYVSPVGYYQPQYMMIHINVDVAAVIRAITESRVCAYQLGQQARHMSEQSGIENEIMNRVDAQAFETTKNFIGVYDKNSYGIYDNDEAYATAYPYFDSATMIAQKFSSYEEARVFSRSGVAYLRNMDFEKVPNLNKPINWRQVVRV